MGLFGSIFKSIVETVISGNQDTVYTFNYAGFCDKPNFRDCFEGGGINANDGGLLIKQICAYGLVRIILANELVEYKDDYISCIAERMQYDVARIVHCIQQGDYIVGGVREIVKFISLEFSGDNLSRTVVQVEVSSGHRVTFRVDFPSELFQISKYSLERYSYIPGFRLPSVF